MKPLGDDQDLQWLLSSLIQKPDGKAAHRISGSGKRAFRTLTLRVDGDDRTGVISSGFKVGQDRVAGRDRDGRQITAGHDEFGDG